MALLFAALCVAFSLSACDSSRPTPGNLLKGRALTEVRGVANAERIIDGIVPREGDPWRSNLSAELPGRNARIQIDLGSVYAIDALSLVGDNNDRFEVAISEDGKRFIKLWEALPVPLPGMRARYGQHLGGHGRYLRITARGPDAFVSMGELLAFETSPAVFPAPIARTASESVFAAELRWLTWFGALLSLAMLTCFVRVPVWLTVPAFLLAAFGLVTTTLHFIPLWPFHEEIVSFFRVVLAVVGALGLVIARGRVRPAAITALLLTTALLALGCFYNFGRPWFLDFTKGRPTPVHSYDMRVYYPVAKYFDELRFDGLYFASVAAYLEGTGQAIKSVANTELRDLRTNQLVRVRDVAAEIEHVHERFSPARWAAFKEDMRYFWTSMSRDHYLGTLRDHGGNATPAWLAIAHLMFAGTKASERVLTMSGMLDPLLLLTILICVWRSFGRYTALACLIVFGTTDFPMLGSNWAGSTLRFDWMAGLALSACAFRSGRHALAGALLGYAAMMRAFPVLSIALVVGATTLELALHMKREGRLPAWNELRVKYRGVLRAASAALIVMVALFTLSSGMFGLKVGWGEWGRKIELHNEKSNTNHVGLRTVMSWSPSLIARRLQPKDGLEPWQRWHVTQSSTFASRKPQFWLAALMFVAAAVWVCAGTVVERAVLLGLLLVPVLTYPANYYMHAIFILPMLASGLALRRMLLLEITVLAACVAQYFTLYKFGGDERFFYQSVILLSATALILALLAWEKLSNSRAEPTR